MGKTMDISELYGVSPKWCHTILLAPRHKPACPTLTYRLRDIIANRGWKSPFSPTVFWLYRPTSSAISIYTSLKSTFGEKHSVTDNIRPRRHSYSLHVG